MSKTIEVGEPIEARTHAELLNQLFELNYQQFMRCGYSLADRDGRKRFSIKDKNGIWKPEDRDVSVVWMAYIENGVHGGWENEWNEDRTQLTERYYGDANEIKKHWAQYRFVFEIGKNDAEERTYIFRGIFGETSDGVQRSVYVRTHKRIGGNIEICDGKDAELSTVAKFDAISTADGLLEYLLNCAKQRDAFFYYTDLETLKKIHESKTLWLTRADCFNDVYELAYADADLKRRTYIVSFSHVRVESIAMWRMYSRPIRKGVRLEFTDQAIRDLITKDVDTVKDGKSVFKDPETGEFLPQTIIKDCFLVDVVYEGADDYLVNTGKSGDKDGEKWRAFLHDGDQLFRTEVNGLHRSVRDLITDKNARLPWR